MTMGTGLRLLVVDKEMFSGGVETLRMNLLPEMARFCDSIVWVLPPPHDRTFRDRFCDVPNLAVECISWPRVTLPQVIGALMRRLPNALFSEQLRRKVSHWLERWRVQSLSKKNHSTNCLTTCVFSQTPPDTGLPLAGIVCDLNPVIPERIRHNIVHWLRTADLIFGISEFTAAELRQLAPDSRSKICAVPLAAPRPGSAKTDGRLEQVDFYFPGLASPHKGHLVLFRACILLAHRGVKFSLILSGPGIAGFRKGQKFANPGMEETRLFLEQNADELGEKIVIAGDLTPEQIGNIYRSTRCVVLPSSYEGFGMPLAEALRFGKQVVCSDIPTFREQVEMYQATKLVQFVPADNPALLADAMARALDEPVSVPVEEADRRMAVWTWTDVARRCCDKLNALRA